MSVKVKIRQEKYAQTYNVEKMFDVAFRRFILINSKDVERGHNLNVLEDGYSSKIVILSDHEDQDRARNTHHDYEEIPTDWIIFKYCSSLVFEIEHFDFLLCCQQKHRNQMDFRINAFFERVSE